MSAVLRRRLQELLAVRATQGLDAAERQELEAILKVHPDWDDEGYDLAAAALDLALQSQPPELPTALQQRLQAQARSWTPPPAASR